MRASQFSHPALTEFATVATDFCETVENAALRAPEALLDQIHQLLPRAYSAALRLPDASIMSGDGVDSGQHEAAPNPASETSPPGLGLLAAFLGRRGFYRQVFDPYAEPADGEVTGNIIDDLGDIYRDLQRGLAHWHDGKPGEALWAWRFNFEIHWGQHATSALRAIFALSAWHEVPWPTGAD